MALWRKIAFFILAAIILPLIVPVASALTTFLFHYEYEHLLIVSMFRYWTDPHYALMSLVAACFAYFFAAYGIFRLVSPKFSIYGDARLASYAEMRKKGLFDVKGDSIILGYVGKKLAVFNEDLHTFLGAMTGSGKGVSFVIPNLLNWVHSCIVVDIKRDIHMYTSGFRKHILRQKVFVFEPLSVKTDAFNPLSFVSDEPDLIVDDLQKIAETLCPIDDPYFDGQARVLFVGLMQLLLEAHDKLGWQCSIGQVLRLLGTEQEIGEFLKNTIASLDEAGTPLTASCKSNLFSFINEPEKPRGSIRSSLVNHLQLWTNPRIDRATSHSTFDFSTFRKTPQTLYLVAAPKDLERLGSLFRLLFDSFLSVNTKVGEQPRDQPDVFKHDVLLMLDEFISMGVMHNVVHALSYVRGWGIKVATVIQSPKQLESKYDPAGAEAFEDGHRARVFFRPSRANKNAATDLAEAIGRYTGKSGSVSRPTGFSGGGNRSYSESDADLYLFTPDQIRNMPDSRCFLMIDGLRPVYARKIKYHEDKYFKNLIHPPLELPPELTKGDAVYPEQGLVQGNEIQALLPQELAIEIATIDAPEKIDDDNVDDIAEQLLNALQEATI